MSLSRAAQKKWAAVFALLIAGSGLAYIAMGGIEKNLVYYWDAAQLLQKGKEAYGATVRLGGVVQKGSIDWNATTLALRFRVGIAPEGEPSVVVHAKGAPPQMFQESMGVVVEGHYDGAVFAADRVMVKHSNEYRAPAPGEKPQSLLPTMLHPNQSQAPLPPL